MTNCPAVVNIRGENHGCEIESPHRGLDHENRAAGVTWQDSGAQEMTELRLRVELKVPPSAIVNRTHIAEWVIQLMLDWANENQSQRMESSTSRMPLVDIVHAQVISS